MQCNINVNNLIEIVKSKDTNKEAFNAVLYILEEDDIKYVEDWLDCKVGDQLYVDIGDFEDWEEVPVRVIQKFTDEGRLMVETEFLDREGTDDFEFSELHKSKFNASNDGNG